MSIIPLRGDIFAQIRPRFPQDILHLGTPARAPTAHAPIATPIPGHDRSADVAAWGVAHVDQVFHGVGGVIVDAAIFHASRAAGCWLLASS